MVDDMYLVDMPILYWSSYMRVALEGHNDRAGLVMRWVIAAYPGIYEGMLGLKENKYKSQFESKT